jgi:hypothetical protein
MSLIPEYVRRALRNTPGLGPRPFRMTGAAFKPQPVQLPKLSEMPEREEDWVILHLVGKPKASEAAAAAEATPLVTAPKPVFTWLARKDATHTCEAWESDDPFENPPSLWCPACRFTAEQRHEEASRRAAEQPPAAAAAPAHSTTVAPQSTGLRVNAFQKEFIEAGGPAGRMMRDHLLGGGTSKYMHSWADYCLMEDPHYLDVKELTEEQRLAARAYARRAAPQMRSVRIKSDKTAAEREAECRAWLTTPRNKRKAFHNGALIAKDCLPKDNSLVVANVLNDSQTAFGDLRQLMGEHGVVVDIYRPAAPGAPVFVGFHSAEDVNKVLAAFPNGIRYEGRMLPVERAKDRSKSSKQMAAAAGGGGGGRA